MFGVNSWCLLGRSVVHLELARVCRKRRGWVVFCTCSEAVISAKSARPSPCLPSFLFSDSGFDLCTFSGTRCEFAHVVACLIRIVFLVARAELRGHKAHRPHRPAVRFGHWMWRLRARGKLGASGIIRCLAAQTRGALANQRFILIWPFRHCTARPNISCGLFATHRVAHIAKHRGRGGPRVA